MSPRSTGRRQEKLWGGRFRQRTHRLVETFTESISFDWRLYKQDIRGSIAHARMLAKVGLITIQERDALVRGLQDIEKEIEAGRFRFDAAREDIHMHIEAALIERLGPVGEKLHTARSRNDQVALDMRLWVRDAIDDTVRLLRGLQRALVGQAEKNRGVVFPGYTHLQHAQPVLLAHHLLAYCEMFERDRERLLEARRRVNVCPLGSGALAGTSLPIDRRMTARELGFETVAANSLDAVSDRDFVLEYLFALTAIGLHLSRLSEELVLWSSEEFGIVKLPDAFCTGSSMLPQKRNPDVAELARGRTGPLLGHLVSFATTLKGLPLSYNRDLQEDKQPVFRSTDLVRQALEVFSAMIPHVEVRAEVAARRLSEGCAQAADLAEYLVRKGVPFRESHRIVGRIVADAAERGVPLSMVSLETLRRFSAAFAKDVLPCLDPMTSPSRKVSEGGTSARNVAAQIRRWHRRLKST